MAKKSAGILLFREANSRLEFLLAHPGGPFWAKKDLGVWSIPKGEFESEEPLVAAIREFEEETGQKVSGDFIPLKPVTSKSGKLLISFGLKHDFDITKLKSNLFKMEWPPKSGRQQSFPEVDRVEWFDYATAREKINGYQVAIVQDLARKVIG